LFFSWLLGSPFCVRSRLALGLKNIKHEVVFMANDEGITTKLIGKKAAPVLQMVADDIVMPEVRLYCEVSNCLEIESFRLEYIAVFCPLLSTGEQEHLSKTLRLLVSVQ